MYTFGKPHNISGHNIEPIIPGSGFEYKTYFKCISSEFGNVVFICSMRPKKN